MCPSRAVVELLQRAAGDGFSADALTSGAFEELCFELAREWADANLAPTPYSITFRERQPIDIVVQETRALPALPAPGFTIVPYDTSGDSHFIECKYYGRKLDLDVVSKPYLMALRWRPRTLVIATNSRLTHRAIEFARWLFGTALSGQTACATWNPLELAKQLDGKASESPASLSYTQEHVRPYELTEWALWSSSQLAPVPLFSSRTSGLRTYLLGARQSIQFRATLYNPVTSRTTHSAQLTLRTNTVDGDIVVPLDISDPVANTACLTGEIRGDMLAPGCTAGQPALELTSSSGRDIIAEIAGFPALTHDHCDLTLPNMRPDEARRLGESWLTRGNSPILFLAGEGGVGKTFLCSELCSNAADLGYHTAHTPLSNESEPAFLAELFWLLLPSSTRHAVMEGMGVDFTGSFVEALAHHYGIDSSSSTYDTLTSLLVDGHWRYGELEATVGAIARLLVGSSTPILFVISNCHRASEATSQAIRALTAALDSAGWGNIKLIFEFRDTSEDRRDPWDHLRTWLMDACGHRVAQHRVVPLNDEQVQRFVDGVIMSPSTVDVAASVASKCGGNPLYITSLLYDLLEHDILKVVSSGTCPQLFAVESLPEFRDHVVDLPPDVVDLVGRRISYWHEYCRDRKLAVGAETLGLLAFAGIGTPVEIIAPALGVGVGEAATVLAVFARAGLIGRDINGEYSFLHEYFRAAASQWFASQANEIATLRTVVLACLPANYPVSLLKGRICHHLGDLREAEQQFDQALQFATGDFVRTFNALRELRGIYALGDTQDSVSRYHSSTIQMLRYGYYTQSQRNYADTNLEAVRHLEGHRGSKLGPAECRTLMRQYYHNISNSAAKALRLPEYFEYAIHAIRFCANELELAQVMNRFIKLCAVTGHMEMGRQAILVALGLQAGVRHEDDPCLPSVLYGEASFLYAGSNSQVAHQIANCLDGMKSTPRQRAHDLIAMAAAAIRIGEWHDALSHVAELRGLVDELSLRSLRAAVANVEGLLMVTGGNLAAAQPYFRASASSAAWQDARSEELRYTTNLMVTRAANSELMLARENHERLLQIGASLLRHPSDTELKAVFSLARSRSAAIGCAAADDIKNAALFPPFSTRGPHILAVVLHNANELHLHYPDEFSAPENYGFTREELADIDTHDYSTLIHPVCSGPCSQLVAIC